MATKTFTGTGLASTPARWSGGTLPVSGDKIVNNGVMTLDGSYVWGDGTSSTTLANNAIVNNGTMLGSTSVPWSLTCVGSIVQGAGSSVIFDQSAGGSGTLILNSGGTVGQHGFTTIIGAGVCTTTIKGIPRTRNTTLSTLAPAGATSVQVVAAANWSVGDEICIASDTADPARAHYTTVAAGYTPGSTTVPINAPLNFARQSRCQVGNFSSNMTVSAAVAANGSICALNAGASGKITSDIQGVRFENIASSTGWTGGAQTTPNYFGLSLTAASSSPGCSISDCAIIHTLTSSLPNATLAVVNAQSLEYARFINCAMYSASDGFGLYFASSALGSVDDCVIYKCAKGYNSSFSFGGFQCQINNGAIFASNYLTSLNAGIVTCTNVTHKTVGPVVGAYVSGVANYVNGYLECGTRLLTQASNVQGGCNSTGTILAGSVLTGENTIGSASSQIARSKLYFVAGVATDNYDINYHRVVSSDTATRRHGTFSIKIQPKVANTAITYTFTVPAVSGVAQVIKGSLRFDSTYGTATPPVIALSGQGVTASYTCAAVADAWDDFTLSFTPTSTGDITVTITVQSASTAGYAWLDGVYHYPMIQAVRHWGYQWLPQAAQLVDARITLTEAAALALPVSVSHGASTVTITGSVTPSQALQAMLADLAQTANNARAVHCTGDGSTFATSYTVILSGSGAVSGPYTDATGLHVSITSSALDAGTLVQVWDVAATTELYIGTPSGTLLLPIVYPGTDKTLRLRAMQCGAAAASRFVEQMGTLTSAGASFLVAQSPDPVYAANAIDGSTVTGITIDDTLMRFVLAGRTSISWAEIYAYETWWLSTVAGMRDDGRIITAIDPANYVFEGFLLRNDNPGGAPITITGGWGRDSVTGQTITLIDTTGGPIFAAPDAVIAYGQAAATPTEIWSHTSRTLTADPGAAGHATTQAAVAAAQSVAQAARDQAALAVALSA